MIIINVFFSTQKQTEPVPSTSGTQTGPIPSTSSTNDCAPRRSARLKRKVSYTDMDTTDSTDDSDWPLPLRLLKEMMRKPDTVNVGCQEAPFPSRLQTESASDLN